MYNFRRNVVTKKLYRYVNDLLRPIYLLNTEETDYADKPSVLVNSFPKSGTHLLHQIIKGIPDTVDKGNFIASKPSFTFSETSPGKIGSRLSTLLPGEIVPSHIHYHESYDSLLKNKNVFSLFIYRDLRDVTISEAHYLSNMNRWHKLSKYFRSCSHINEAVELSLDGLPTTNPIEYENVADRFGKYKGWLNSENTMVIKFEELISKDSEKVLGTIADRYISVTKNENKLRKDELVRAFKDAFNPGKSHTFRSGKTKQWKEIYTPEMNMRFEQYLLKNFTEQDILKFKLY